MRLIASSAMTEPSDWNTSTNLRRMCTIRTQSTAWRSRRSGPLPGRDSPDHGGPGGPPEIMGGDFRDKPRRRLVPCSTLGSVRRRLLTAGSTTGRLLILKEGAVEIIKEGVEIAKVT